MIEENQRLRSVDILKGILIVAVVFVHLLISRSDILVTAADAASIGGSEGSPGIASLVIQALYLGLMFFFIFSGYFYRPGRGFVANMKKRSIQLVVALSICAIILPMIIYGLMAICGKAPDMEDLLSAFQWGFGLNGVFEPYDVFTPHPLCGGSVGYYYLWGMFWGFLIFYFLADHVYDDWKKSVVAIITLLVITLLLREFFPVKLPMYAQMGPIAAAFMLTGMMMAKMKLIERIESFDPTSRYSYSLLFGSLIIVVVMVYLFPPGLEFDYLNFGEFGGYSVIPYYIEAVAMFIFMTHLAMVLYKVIGLRQMFTVCGQHTLGILLLHGPIATMMIVPFYDLSSGSWFPDTMGLIPSVIVTIVTIVVCLLICIYGKTLLGRLMGAEPPERPLPCVGE